jgi:hypothetical protein
MSSKLLRGVGSGRTKTASRVTWIVRWQRGVGHKGIKRPVTVGTLFPQRIRKAVLCPSCQADEARNGWATFSGGQNEVSVDPRGEDHNRCRAGRLGSLHTWKRQTGDDAQGSLTMEDEQNRHWHHSHRTVWVGEPVSGAWVGHKSTQAGS